MSHVVHALHVALAYAGRVALVTGVELALVVGPPLALAALAQPVALQSERWTERLVGRRARWIAVGWLATALHEAGHALFALLFGHRVRRVKWFDFAAEGGTLGQVEHDYDPSSFYQRAGRFFIGVGPILLAGLVLVVAARMLLGPLPSAGRPPVQASDAATLEATLGALVAQLGAAARAASGIGASIDASGWRGLAFLYVAYVCGGAMRLSSSDVRSFAAGGWTILSLLLVVNALTLWSGVMGPPGALRLGAAMTLCDAALLAAVVLQAVVGSIALCLTLGMSAVRGRDGALAGR